MSTPSLSSETIARRSAARLVVPEAPIRCDALGENGVTRLAWEAYVSGHEDGSVFHTLGWRHAVASSFPHEPIYLVARRAHRVVGVLPMFFVRSRLAGRMLVSVPYGVGGGILADTPEVAAELFEAARKIATARRCATIELRSERASLPDLPIRQGYAGFRRVLPVRLDEVLGWLPRKARAAARNGEQKFGLTVSFGAAHLRAVWELYALSMRRLASLAYPFSFFERLAASTPGRHWVTLVRWDGRPVAGLVTLLFRDRVMPYFLGTTEEAKRCSAANFIYWKVMERAVEKGYRAFDFGRSRVDNAGSYNFKRFHGFVPRPLEYQTATMPGCKAPDLTPGSAQYALARRIWPHLPLIVTKLVGARVARHIPG